MFPRPGVRLPRLRPPVYIRPLFSEGKGLFRWAALSGAASDIHKTDKTIVDLFPENEPLHRRIRITGERGKAGGRFNDMVASGELAATLAIGRDHLDSGSVDSPYRETEAMLDCSDAIADWPLLNAMVNVASGASWVAIHHGGGVGMGRSIHAGQVSVADGTKIAGEKLRRVLTNDPAWASSGTATPATTSPRPPPTSAASASSCVKASRHDGR